VVTTFVGGFGETKGAFADSTGTQAGFKYPWGLTLDVSGNIIVADSKNMRIRMVTPAGVVRTVAGGVMGTNSVFADATGSLAGFKDPVGVSVDSIGNVIVSDIFSYRIRQVTPVGVVTTIAGSGTLSNADGIGTTSSFRNPGGVSVDAKSGNIIVADVSNHNIRILTPLAGTIIINMACANTFAVSCDIILSTIVVCTSCSVTSFLSVSIRVCLFRTV
jgi:hypothetical protein